MATLRLEIITAERLVYADDVEIVVAPGVEGQLGIRPRHGRHKSQFPGISAHPMVPL